LMGFDVSRIAHALQATEAATLKRLTRAKQAMRACSEDLTPPVGQEITPRVHAVLNALYLVFAIGLRDNDQEVAAEICEDALRLCRIMSSSAIFSADSRVDALLALMLLMLHRRFGDIQARAEGLRWLRHSARGDQLSSYHLEAAIAEQRGRRPEEQDVDALREYYDLLLLIAPSASAAGARAELD
jgi:predicted RNA polymerase sigma factor